MSKKKKKGERFLDKKKRWATGRFFPILRHLKISQMQDGQFEHKACDFQPAGKKEREEMEKRSLREIGKKCEKR